MHIFVINLPQDVARREALAGQLRTLGLPFEIFPAILGKSLSPEEMASHYDGTWFHRNEGRPARSGEIGCALSHIAVWRLVVERKIPHSLILEDDAWLNPNLPQLLEAIEQQKDPDQKNVFLLTWFKSIAMWKFETLWASYHIADVRSAVCAHGYVVSRAAAEALVKALYPVRHVPDPWDWLLRHRIVKLRAVFPTCITVDMSYESRLTNVHPGKDCMPPIGRRLAHKAYRLWWRGVDHALALMRRIGIFF